MITNKGVFYFIINLNMKTPVSFQISGVFVFIIFKTIAFVWF